MCSSVYLNMYEAMYPSMYVCERWLLLLYTYSMFVGELHALVYLNYLNTTRQIIKLILINRRYNNWLNL